MEAGEVNLGIDKIILGIRVSKDENLMLEKNAQAVVQAMNLVQLTSKKKKFFQYSYKTSDDDKVGGKPHLFVEYNPASLTAPFFMLTANFSKMRKWSIESFWEIGKLLSKGFKKPFAELAEWRYLEVFLDVNHPYEDVQIYKARSQQYFHDGDSPKRTFYFGGIQANGRIRCYDKKKQLAEEMKQTIPDSHRTRIEILLRPPVQKFYLSTISQIENPFLKLDVFSAEKLKSDYEFGKRFPEVRMAISNDKTTLVKEVRLLPKHEVKPCLNLMRQSVPDWWKPDELFEQWVALLPKYKLGLKSQNHF